MALGLRHGRLSGLMSAGVGAGLFYRGLSGHCAVYEAFGVNTADHNEAVAVPAQQGVKIEKSIIINRPASDLYAFWRRLENLPEVFRHLKQVDVCASGCSRWVAQGPFNRDVAWDAEIINDRPNELIAWRSLPGGDIDTAGSVRFKSLSGMPGTEVTVSLKYNPPAGKLGATIAGVFGSDPQRMILEDLRRFKSLMEAGEMSTARRQPAGVRGAGAGMRGPGGSIVP